MVKKDLVEDDLYLCPAGRVTPRRERTRRLSRVRRVRGHA